MFARHLIDTIDFASHGKELSGKVSVSEMPRLLSLLVSSIGEIEFGLHGGLNKDGDPFLVLVAQGVCQLRCQRCLESMVFPIKLESRLLLVESGLDDLLLDDDGEEDSIPASAKQDVVELLEDEILLNLPFAPKHLEGVCSAPIEVGRQAADHPFAVLAGLKNK